MSLSCGHSVNALDEACASVHRFAVHFQNHVARRKACIVRRAARTHVLNAAPFTVLRNVELLTHVGSQVIDRQTQLAPCSRRAGVLGFLRPPCRELAHGDFSVSGLPLRRMPSSMLVPGAISLTATCSAPPFAICFPLSSRSTSPRLQTRAAGRRVRRHLAHDGAAMRQAD